MSSTFVRPCHPIRVVVATTAPTYFPDRERLSGHLVYSALLLMIREIIRNSDVVKTAAHGT